jgi:C1A family cysteine protease
MAREAEMSRKFAVGWIPDCPDFRDCTDETEEVRAILKPTGVLSLGRGKKSRAASEPPASVDLREWCSPGEDQVQPGSCTANAGAGIIEYYERKSSGRHTDTSRLFLYKVTRNLMMQRGDTGADLQTTIGARVLFGVAPEEYWPYTNDPRDFDNEPPAFCYSFAQNHKTLEYYRHDPRSAAADAVLNRLKAYRAAGHPAVFGFTVYSSIEQASDTGRIPFPSLRDKIEGGHAVVAVGYDEKLRIKNKYGDEETTGAFLIRNSLGKSWGESGYGWLPFEYARKGLAEDFWSILKKEWIDTGGFRI